ncbi:MAG: glycosyltransferase [Planctomycetes bacterium]|nr:glycosyltransferase [Planctomycetota bacterium]
MLIEGWRFLPHSYAIVNQFQCLQFLREPDVALRHHDVPFLQPNWKATKGLFDESAEAAIRAIPDRAAGEKPDALLRVSFPYNLSPSDARRTVVFGTAEFRCVPAKYIAGKRPLSEAIKEGDAIIVTPSNWSREGFIHSGADPRRVVVVPHGVDASIFHPIDPDRRAAMRAERGLEGFVFLTLGAMNATKRMDALLKAFAVVVRKHPHARLVLKGLGELYASQEMLKSQAASLTEAEVALIHSRMHYIESTLTFADMARLYQMADAYVSPYSAEGFNLPVLEAIASGLPVICTRGGSTDDFTTEDFALRVDAKRVAVQQTDDAGGFELRVDFDHLVHQMLCAVESPDLAAKARVAGPAFTAAGFTWGHATRKLLGVLFEPSLCPF